MLTLLEQEYVTAMKPARRERLEAFRGVVVCQDCGGARLRPEARGVPLSRPGDPRNHGADRSARRAPGSPRSTLRRPTTRRSAEPIWQEIAKRLEFLDRWASSI